MTDSINNTLTINGVEYVRADSIVYATPAKPAGPLTLVRTFSAGVHVGELVSEPGKLVTLKNARRIWRWRGANTLNEIAVEGVNRKENTRISKPVPEITLTEVIELIPVAEGFDLTEVWND